VKRIADFWAKFATRDRLEGEIRILENQNLPMLEVNAAYTESVADFPVLISPDNLEQRGYTLEGALALLEIKPLELSSEIWVEQVPWSRAAALSEVWCAQNNALEWQAEVSKELARILESNRDLLAYLAFGGETATGMMLVSSSGFCGLWAASDEVALALFNRGANDFGALEVTVFTERLELLQLAEFRALEQYRVWISAAAL
jgi:hypothetical protein